MKESRGAIIGAIAANAVIALTKFIAAAAAGSGAMFSEGIHSMVDTGDGLLLMLGLHLSQRPASERHPYGRGLETYFWSMVVAMAIFGVGGGVSAYEGILHIVQRRQVEFAWWTFLVLGIAAVFEGISFALGYRAFRRERKGRGVRETIRTSKDPTTFVVVLEDSAALIGLAFAAIGITLAHVLDMPVLDGVASLLIGILLCVVAAILGRETWSLLIGESASPELVESVHAIARQHPGVLDARRPRTIHLGPELVHVDLDLVVDREGDVVATARAIEEQVREKHPVVHRVSLRFVDTVA